MAKRIFPLLLAGFLVSGICWAARDRFVGKWKLNPSRSQLRDEMRIEAVGTNRYALNFSGDGIETIVADGTDQPGLSGTTMSITAEGPRTWKVVRMRAGRPVLMGTWTLSEDGSTLSDDLTGFQADGSIFKQNYVYKRTAGKAGFAGTWESASETVNSVFEIEIKVYEGNGLSMIDSSEGETKNLKFDGRDYPVVGRDVDPGTTASGLRVNERTMEVTDKVNGKTTGTERIELAPDLRTMTLIVHPVGQNTPSILVFDRE